MDENTNDVTNNTVNTSNPKRNGGPLGWFSLGAILGAVIAVVAMSFGGGANRQTASTAPLSEAAIREAARQGANEAIAAEATRTTLEMAQAVQTDAIAQAAQPTPALKIIGPEKPPAETSASNVTIREANVLGKANAPVTIVEFSDFGCYYCTQFYNKTFTKLIDTYVKSGQVKFVYKHMPITTLHPGADMAALASECAADQGKFWDYHNVLFVRNASGFDKDLMIQYASEMKLDAKKFAACLDATGTGQRVQVDMDQAAGLGLRGTPSFLVNGKQLIGAQPYEVFAQAIDAALVKK